MRQNDQPGDDRHDLEQPPNLATPSWIRPTRGIDDLGDSRKDPFRRRIRKIWNTRWPARAPELRRVAC